MRIGSRVIYVLSRKANLDQHIADVDAYRSRRRI